MKTFIAITLFALAAAANAIDSMEKTEIEFKGRTLLVYQGYCAEEDFSIQKVSRGYQFIGPNGTGMAQTPRHAAEQACGLKEIDG